MTWISMPIQIVSQLCKPSQTAAFLTIAGYGLVSIALVKFIFAAVDDFA